MSPAVARCVAEIYEVTCSRCHLTFKVMVEPQESLFAARQPEGKELPAEDLEIQTVSCPHCNRMRVDFIGGTADVLDKKFLEARMMELTRLMKEMRKVLE